MNYRTGGLKEGRKKERFHGNETSDVLRLEKFPKIWQLGYDVRKPYHQL